MSVLEHRFTRLQHRIAAVDPQDRVGKVVQVTGLVVEAEGPSVSLGDVCRILSPRRDTAGTAEVVGFRDNRVLLMPLDDLSEIHPGCKVVLQEQKAAVPVGDGLVGRVIDGLARPIDGKGPLDAHVNGNKLHAQAVNPMVRRRIAEPFSTGVKALDTFTPLGCGQRVGIFAGSGVGKSTLLGMIARGASSDINVIALIGERGRELREFIENDLGPEGMARSIVVVSTSDQPAPLRLRAAYLATAIAEYFRDDVGQRVLLMMDSLTRFAMAQREIGLAIGEPPTSRGYTPSVFAQMPRLLERAGQGEQGSITGLYTVLVEGDDLNEPITDAARGILDGHIVLSRTLATANHYPAVDVLSSVSRLARAVCAPDQVEMATSARDLLALYRKNEDLINIGAYARGSNPRIDRAITAHDQLTAFLKQPHDQSCPRDEAFSQLQQALS